MNRPFLFFALLIGALTTLLWAVLNQPNQEPPWPEVVQGFSFNPMRADSDPAAGRYPTVEQIDADLALLAGHAHAVRTYSVDKTLGEIPALAKKHKLNVALGAWISDDEAANERQLDRLLTIYRKQISSIVRVIIGNEAILRKERTPEQMIAYLDRMQSEISAPISTAEPWHIWLKHPELAAHVDFIGVHILPYWENIPLSHAITFVKERYKLLEQAFPDKPIVITEIGWPSRGRTRGDAKASPANQATFLRRFLAEARQEGYVYYVLEAFDQVWKREIEGEAGTAWGVYNAKRVPKFTFTEPIVRIPNWRVLTGISIGLAILVLAVLLRDSKGLNYRGHGFLTLITYGIVTFTVWMVFDFTERYLTPGTLAVGVLMIVAALGIALVLLAEAHELAEAMWRRGLNRTPLTITRRPTALQPFVSIHVPAYNEPPEMLKQTLDALARIDYPRFEVLVIDNNTRDPAVWQPVAEHCSLLGERFRFFHVAPLEGFKAGALNFALRHTAPEAEVVAVIDSDYQVTSGWLADLVPFFDDEKTAIVQAPQDYRDGGDNAFKAMCQAEYQGFFHIGMVNRNERNAIIQHGTMTMVRRGVLEDVDGWSEWCITEDAELGFRIFRRGYEAVYTPVSYGRGLMPDTFLDFKKQRFRWAYGAVLILRHHVSSLLGFRRTGLTAGQRYHFVAGWLPWFADGMNLFFTVGAITWSAAMILQPQRFMPPDVLFSFLPLSFFVFKMSKMAILYRWRVNATWRQSLAAALAGLALSHTIARAMLAGFITRKIGFFRTPKQAQTNRFFAALYDAREEMLFAAVLLFCVTAMIFRQDLEMLDTRLWIAVLAVQSLPYIAAVLVSVISAFPRLPAWLVGPMHSMDNR